MGAFWAAVAFAYVVVIGVIVGAVGRQLFHRHG